MKKLGIVFVLILNLISCSNDSDNIKAKTETDYVGKWTLVKMTGSVINSETTGSKMEWQESYVFNIDGTFLKTRVQDNVVTTSGGTFEIKKDDDYAVLKLIHYQSNSIIGNCSGDLSEFFSVNKDGFLQSSWWSCDGPGLFYKKS